jgi:hypothetical protein
MPIIINLLFPTLLIYLSTKIIQIFYLQNFFKSIFLVNIFINIYYYLILKINIFYLGNFLLIFLITISFIYFLIKKKIIITLKEISIFYTTIILIYFYSKNFYLYKYDEFSEYGIITKLIFYINTLPINDNTIYGKGTYEKINILSCFYIFFLKNTFLDYYENIIIFANIFYIVILILNILNEFKNLSIVKKIFAFFSIIIFTYMLSSGLDRIYPETIISLLLCLIMILTNKLNQKFNKLNFIIILLSLFLIFSIKNSGIVISVLISFFLIINFFFKKKYKAILGILLLLFFNQIFLKIHGTPLNYNETYNPIITYNKTYATIPKTIADSNQVEFIKIIKSIWKSNVEESIYHLYSFSALNNFLSIIKINFKLPSIGLNFFFWILVLATFYYLDKISFLKKKIYFLCIILILIFYEIILTIWAYQHHLVNEDGTLLISWSRHLGSVINGFLMFYFLNNLSELNKGIKKIMYLIIIFIIIFIPARAARGITPQFIENKISFWKNKFELRENIDKLTNKIKATTGGKTFVLLVLENNELDPYFYPILKYNLIKTNVIVISDYKLLEEKLKKINHSKEEYYILSYENNSITNKNFYKEKNINIDLFKLTKI